MNDTQRILYLLITAIVVMAISVVVTFVYLVQITGTIKQQSEDNFKAIGVQIPALRRQINDRERTIAKLEAEKVTDDYVLNKQAVPALVYLIKQVEELGGKPPPVLLNPEEPPFDPKEK